MEPTPGGVLDQLASQLADPLYVILAHLAKGPIGVQNAVVDLQALVEADFPGYAAQVVSPNTDTGVDDEFYGEMNPTTVTFTSETIVTPQRCSHIYYTASYDGGSPTLLAVVPFETPLVIDKSGVEMSFDVHVGAVVLSES